MVNRVSDDIIKDIRSMAAAGYTIRNISAYLGISKNTALKYALTTNRPDNVSAKKMVGRKRKFHFLCCGYCEQNFLDKNGEKTSDLKHGRIKRAFCTHRCAMNFRSKQRHNDKCVRCGVTRGELAVWRIPGYEATGVCFTKGHCPRCAGLRQQYQGNETLMNTHELTQLLKKENTNENHR